MDFIVKKLKLSRHYDYIKDKVFMIPKIRQKHLFYFLILTNFLVKLSAVICP